MASNSDDQKETERWIRQFPRAANQRFTTAQFLFEHGYYLDAMDLAGYAAECAFKAVILTRTSRRQRGSTLKEITSGKESHNLEHLNDLLKKRGCALPLEIALHLRKIAKAKWSTAWRYEAGRRAPKEAEEFLDHVKGILGWMERSR